MNINCFTSNYAEIAICGEIITLEEDGKDFKVTAEQGMLEIEESVKLIAVGFKPIELIRCGNNKKQIVELTERTIELTEEEMDLIYVAVVKQKERAKMLGDHKDIEMCNDLLLKLDDQ